MRRKFCSKHGEYRALSERNGRDFIKRHAESESNVIQNPLKSFNPRAESINCFLKKDSSQGESLQVVNSRDIHRRGTLKQKLQTVFLVRKRTMPEYDSLKKCVICGIVIKVQEEIIVVDAGRFN